MKERIIIDKINSERLLKEMNSLLFRAYLDICIGHSQLTGYETRFKIMRSKQENGFYYSNKIEVGDPNEVGRPTQRHLKLLQEFEKKFGPPPTKPPLSLLHEDENAYIQACNRYIKRYGKYHALLNKYLKRRDEDLEIEVPVPYNKSKEYAELLDDSYLFLDGHTHPSKKIHVSIPSPGDVAFLRDTKLFIEEYGVGMDIPKIGLQNKAELVASPVLLIIGTAEYDHRYELGLVSCCNSAASDQEISEFQEELFNLKINSLKLSLSNKGPQTFHDRNFCYVQGYYDLNRKKVTFCPNSLDALLEVN